MFWTNEIMNRTLRFGLFPIALALTGPARADTPAAAAPDDVATLRADNKQLSDELAAAWKESEKLKAELAEAQSASSKTADQAADLQKQLEAAKAAPAAAAPAPASDLADAQDKLATALRSFTVVQDENTDLKATVDKLSAQVASLSQQLDIARSSIASLQVQAAAISQIEPLQQEVRHAQDEVSRLALENGELRTRLSLQGPGPGAKNPPPLRPGAAPALEAAAPAAAAPTPAPAPKTYVVADGDTLTRISRKFYGTSARWEDILNANRDTLKDEKSLSVGSTLRIP